MYHLPNKTILNRNSYQIIKVIGQGGFGITYLAYEIGFYRSTGFNDQQYVKASNPEIVVIKELFYAEYCIREKGNPQIIVTNEKKTDFQKLVQNQLDEGKKLRTLNHKHIVPTRDIFKENNTAYMVMDYVDSYDLDDLITEKGKIPIPEALAYITQVLSALVHIHKNNQLHLDIKPSNILIRKSNKEAVLIDFGASQSYEKTGQIVGRTSQLVTAMTKHYAPNEQADIDNLKHFDATFDTYAVGATLYHMLTGQKPPASSLLSTGRETLIPPSQIIQKQEATEYMDAIVVKSLSPLYQQRFNSANQFVEKIQRYDVYQDTVQTISSLVDKQHYQQAEQQLEKAIKEFLPTKTLLTLSEQISQQIAYDSKEDTIIIAPRSRPKKTQTIATEKNSLLKDEKTELLISNSSKKKKENITKKRIWILLLVALVIVGGVLVTVNYLDKAEHTKTVSKNPTRITKDTLYSPTVKKEKRPMTDAVAVKSSEVDSLREMIATSSPKISVEKKDTRLVAKQKTQSLPQQSTLSIGGNRYEGIVHNNLPDGHGVLYFSKKQKVSKRDLSNTQAQAGDYIKGKWNKGELEYGTLYNQNHEKKKTIIIGRY